MAVRGLGCPVRFALTAGQKGDAPQAEALLAGLPAAVVMAEGLVRQRLVPTDHGELAPPPPKAYTGLLQGFSGAPSD